MPEFFTGRRALEARELIELLIDCSDWMNYHLLSDNMLWKLVKVSDGKAFEEVYRRHWKAVFQAAYYRIRSKEVAQELVQNLYLRLWEKRETLAIDNLEGYLHTAIKNSIFNYIESRIVEKKYHDFAKEQDAVQTGGPDSPLLVRELSHAIERALDQLPQKTRQIFRLSRFEHQSAREIAQHMNLTEKAVEYHITKSLKLIRVQLKDYLLLLALLLLFCS